MKTVKGIQVAQAERGLSGQMPVRSGVVCHLNRGGRSINPAAPANSSNENEPTAEKGFTRKIDPKKALRRSSRPDQYEIMPLESGREVWGATGYAGRVSKPSRLISLRCLLRRSS